MAAINYNRKFIYLFEPYCASRTTLKLLKGQVAGTSEVGHHHITLDHLTDWRRQHINPKRTKDFRVVTTVRNPFDILVTQWMKSVHRHEKIDYFIHINRASSPMDPAFGLYKDAAHFCWYEDLENDLRWMFTDLDLTLEYDDAHKTKEKKPWQEYFNPELIDMLSKRPAWIAYMERFGYRVYSDGGFEMDMGIRANLCKPL